MSPIIYTPNVNLEIKSKKRLTQTSNSKRKPKYVSQKLNLKLELWNYKLRKRESHNLYPERNSLPKHGVKTHNQTHK